MRRNGRVGGSGSVFAAAAVVVAAAVVLVVVILFAAAARKGEQHHDCQRERGDSCDFGIFFHVFSFHSFGPQHSAHSESMFLNFD